ncbi:MAG: SUMF1/EgtB/PvdO family nonheme iron enzyme [Desulfurivibrionaceae bacterium]
MPIGKKIIGWLIVGLVAGPGCVVREIDAPGKPGSEADKLVEAEQGSVLEQKRVTSLVDSWTEPTTSMEFVRIPGGCFQMGNPGYLKIEDGNEGPVHEVCLDEFYMGRFGVTGATN